MPPSSSAGRRRTSVFITRRQHCDAFLTATQTDPRARLSVVVVVVVVAVLDFSSQTNSLKKPLQRRSAYEEGNRQVYN